MTNELSLKLKLIKDALPGLIEHKLDRCGYIVEERAKLNCNVNTGRLRSSITHKTDEECVVIGTNVEYAPYVHEGNGRYVGNPFLQDALNESIADVKNELKCTLEELDI